MNDIPAFPESYVDGVAPYEGIGGGMTLRDYFAARAMHAVIMSPDNFEVTGKDDIADMAYRMADAMLTERSKKS